MTLNDRKTEAANEATSRSSDEATVFFGDALATANNYPVPDSLAWNLANPALLTPDLDPMDAGLPTEGGMIRFPSIDAGAKAMDTFVGKVKAGLIAQLPLTTTIADAGKLLAPTRSADWAKKFADYAGLTTDQPLSAVTG